MPDKAKPPFRFWSFFFSLNGRVSQRAFVLAATLPHFLLFVEDHLRVYLNRMHHLPIMPWFMAQSLVNLALLWPFFAVTFKRFHDANLSGWPAMAYFLPFVAALAVGFSIAVFYRQHLQDAPLKPNLFHSPAYQWSVFAIIWMLALIPIFIPGTRGRNRFGPPPDQPLTIVEDVF